MNIRYYIRGTKELKNIYVRLVSKGIDVSAPVGIFVQEFQWDSKKELCDSNQTNAKLYQLKAVLLGRYNQSYASGEAIDKNWLLETIKSVFQRPAQEVKLVSKAHTIYLSDFCSFWLQQHAKSWKVSALETMGETLKKQYENFVLILEAYEKSLDSKIKLKEADSDFIYGFVGYLSKEQKFSRETVKRSVIRLKFFLKRAEELRFEVNKDYLKPVYLEKQPEIQDVYHSESDIQKLFALDLSDDYKMEAANDNMIMTCWLGLRVSDFMTRFNLDSIKDGYVSIKTQKTGSFVVIPLHPMVKAILAKRFGQLPPKLSNTEYNLLIKKVAEKAGLNELVYGKKYNPETNRKEIGYYKKYELVTSHTGRKSFATNLKGKVPDDVIINCAGWTSPTMLAHYDKRNGKQFAEQLNEYYNGK